MNEHFTPGPRSAGLFEKSCRLIPGGVNSPVRAFGSVGASPFLAARGKGARIFDVDGNEYLDCVCSWGPLILGHARPEVVEATVAAVRNGMTFGTATEGELRLAELITGAIPSIEMVRLTSSGTEAVMSALRLARGATGRPKILKFEGCYHGHSDGMLVRAGSGAATFGVPDSAGVPPEIAGGTLTAPYNDLEAVRTLFDRFGGEIAGVIVEPVAGNMGLVPPEAGFLEGLRALCDAFGALLIFDEVISGFRASYGGAQAVFGVRPDLTTLGKIIGGGMPVGAYGGRRDLMEQIAPAGPVYQAGTLSGNPAAVAAGIATLTVLKEDPAIYARLDALCETLRRGLLETASRRGLPLTVNRAASLLTPFFTEGPVRNFAKAKRSDLGRYAAYFNHMLAGGVFLPPSQFEALFLAAAHTPDDVDRILTRFDSLRF